MDMYGCISTSSASSSLKYYTSDSMMYKYKTEEVLTVEYSTVRRNIFLETHIKPCTKYRGIKYSTHQLDIQIFN
jgi:hypothetical protein